MIEHVQSLVVIDYNYSVFINELKLEVKVDYRDN
jgi:hypothetical protein